MEHIKHWGMHAVLLVCLANNWPWPDHSNIASYEPDDAYSARVGASRPDSKHLQQCKALLQYK